MNLYFKNVAELFSILRKNKGGGGKEVKVKSKIIYFYFIFIIIILRNKKENLEFDGSQVGFSETQSFISKKYIVEIYRRNIIRCKTIYFDYLFN